MHPAFNQIAPLPGIAWAPEVIEATAVIAAAAVVTMTHIILVEAVLTADAPRVTPEGDLIPTTHHNHSHPDNTTIDHNPTEGTDLTTETALNPQEDIIAINPVLQIVNIPGIE